MTDKGSQVRLLVITELFLPTKGGTAVWFDEVYRRLGGDGIHIVTADVPGAQEHDTGHPNRVHRLRLRRYRWLRPESLGMYGRLLIHSAGLAVRYRFSAVHAGRVLPEGLVGLIVARLLGKPLVIYAHGEELTTWKEPGKQRVMRFVYRKASRVVANSAFTREELIKAGVDVERIAMIHPGVDVRRFRPGLAVSDLRERIGAARGSGLILSVGRLSRRKGFDQVIRSIPELVGRGVDVHYAIIGIGEDEEYLAGIAHALGVVNRVHFLGHVPMEDLARWYNAADVFAMPNREVDGDTEGFGMVFVEAGACGKPAIAGVAGGTGAAVADGVTGLRVEGESLEAVVEALYRCLTDHELAARLGEAARDRAVGEVSWEMVAERTGGLGTGTQ